MKTENLLSNILLVFSLTSMVFTLKSCEEPNHELPLVIPEVENATQYVDMYCLQNNTNNVIWPLIWGIDTRGHNIMIGHSTILTPTKMECALFYIHDEDSEVDKPLNLTQRHRINWVDFASDFAGLEFDVYEYHSEDFHENGWKIINHDFFDKKIESSHIKPIELKDMFIPENYTTTEINNDIDFILSPYDKQLLDKYLTQVEPGHVRLHVFSLTDEYLAKE
ncbi:MAG: hypothetical protein IJ650_00590 [Paludibacteraceae bacterium]|nr:hypothetical protein [Paludibacteraceae bacterium]